MFGKSAGHAEEGVTWTWRGLARGGLPQTGGASEEPEIVGFTRGDGLGPTHQEEQAHSWASVACREEAG